MQYMNLHCQCVIQVEMCSRHLGVTFWIFGKVKVPNAFTHPNIRQSQSFTASTLRRKSTLLRDHVIWGLMRNQWGCKFIQLCNYHQNPNFGIFLSPQIDLSGPCAVNHCSHPQFQAITDLLSMSIDFFLGISHNLNDIVSGLLHLDYFI